MNNNPLLNSSKDVDQDTTAIINHISGRFKSPSPDDVHKETGEKYLCRNLIPLSNTEFLSGKGIVLDTNKGKFYDFGAMSLNCILGQNDPWINANLVSYILSGSPSYVSTSAGTTLYYELAEKISKLSGMKDAVVNHRQCNGSDVTELAIIAAYKRRKKGQKYVVSFKGSYHGQNLTSFAVSDLQRDNRLLVDDDVSTVFLNTPTHTQPSQNQDELTENDKSILEELKVVGQQAFAVIIEPIQVNNRVNISSKLFLKELKRVCEGLDVPLIFDDIQTGYGWLGTFSSVHFFGVQPNMMAISKAITGGYGALAALVMDKEYGDLLPSGIVRKTNGSDMRSLAAAKAMIERLSGVGESLIPDSLNENLKQELKEGLLATFPDKERLIEYSLRELKKNHLRLFGELRGTGLIWSIDIVNSEGELNFAACSKIQHDLLERGAFVRDVKGALLFKIPLVFTADELKRGFDVIEEYLKTADL
jgi:4-aminobutyrate aminotransferase-like enzyme